LGYKKGDFPITESMAATCLSLPLWPGMTDDQIQYICDLIIKYYERL
jgi:dTDP-4-amino-4,6-dideoxygalactose transaminase